MTEHFNLKSASHQRIRVQAFQRKQGPGNLKRPNLAITRSVAKNVVGNDIDLRSQSRHRDSDDRAERDDENQKQTSWGGEGRFVGR